MPLNGNCCAGKIGGKRRRHDLTLKERYDVIQKLDGQVPYRILARNFNCSIGQISNIAENREKKYVSKKI
jgi:hypothetical protein